MRLRFVCFCLVITSTLSLTQASRASFKPTVRQKQNQSMGGLNFAKVVTYSTGGYFPTSVAIADVNGDGKPDLIAVNQCPNDACQNPEGSVAVLLGNGEGTFQAAKLYDAGGQSSLWVAVADVNGDGKPDVIVANQCADESCTGGSLSVLLGNGNGTFQAAVAYSPGGLRTSSVAVADLAGNGKLDLVATNACADLNSCENFLGGSVSVLLGNGDGTFQTAVSYPSGSGEAPTSVVAADLSGNNKLDLVIAECPYSSLSCGYGGGDVGVLLGNGDGTFQPIVTYPSGGYPFSAVVAGLTGNGIPDVLAFDTCSGPNCALDALLGVLLGNGDGTFQNVVTYDTGGTGGGAGAVADVNGDGKLDAIVTISTYGCSSGAVGVLLGNGDGTFQKTASFCGGGVGTDASVAVAVADLNGDGMPDLVVVNNNGKGFGALGVLLNDSTTAVLSPANLSFAPQAPGVNSAPQTVTLTNIATKSLTLSGIAIGGTDATGFSQSNNCPVSLATNTSCQIKVSSVPSAAGAQSASLNVTDNAAGSPQTVALTGSGEDFSLAASPTTTTVTPGQAGNYTLTVSPVEGFAQKVAFTCGGAPPQSTCSVTPSSVTLSGTGNETANVAVVTTGPMASIVPFGDFTASRIKLALLLAFSGLSGVGLLGGPAGRSGKRRGWLVSGLSLLCLLVVATTWSACGGGGSSSNETPAGTYAVTVTGTYTAGSATLTHATKITLVVK